MAAGFGVAAAGLAPLVAGAAGLGTALSLANQAGDFEQGIERVGNISGATAEDLGKLRDAAIEAGLRTQFSPDEAAEGLQNLAAQGFNAAESMSLLDSSLDLAAGGQIEIGAATATTAAAIRVFSLATEDAGKATDQLLKITNLTALQAGDLELALGTVAKGAVATSQSLDEMLISMGLVKNTGVDVSVAASSVSSALQFVAKNAQAFGKIGVEVTEQTGEFKDFLDIVAETSHQLDGIGNAAERAALQQKLFGRFGTAAYGAVSAQLKEMVKRRPDINTIEEAIAELRSEMELSEGTAVSFANRLLDTFAGQKRILGGAIQTFAVLLGEPFAKVFKPVVFALAQSVSALARLINALPNEFKIAAAAFFVLSSAIFVASGAMAIFVGLGMALGTFILPLLIKGFLLLGTIMLPLTLAVAGLGAAIGAMVFAARENLGGFGDFVTELWGKVRLAFDGLRQLFDEGVITGKTADQLLDPANRGILNFVRTIFQLGRRVGAFFDGIGIAFHTNLALIEPTIEGVKTAFMELLEAIGLVDSTAGSLGGMDDFAAAGTRVGTVLVDIFEAVVDGVKLAIRFVTGFVDRAKNLFRILAPEFTLIVDNIREVGDSLAMLFHDLGIGTRDSSSNARTMGQTWGDVFVGIMGVLTRFVKIGVQGISLVVQAFRFLIDLPRQFAILWIKASNVVKNVIDAILIDFNKAIIAVGDIAAKVPVGFRTDSIEAVVDAGIRARGTVRNRQEAIVARDRETNRRVAFLEEQGRSSIDAVAAANATEDPRNDLNRQLVGELSRQREEDRKARLAEDKRPIVVQMILDNEKIAENIVNQDRKRNAQGFAVGVPAAVE